MAKSQHDRILASLAKRGAVKVGETNKSLKFSCQTLCGDKFLFLGNSNSVRIGATKARSVPSPRLRKLLLAEAGE